MAATLDYKGDVLQQILDVFKNTCTDGAANVLPDAMGLLVTLATIDLALSLMRSAVNSRGGDPITIIVMRCIKYGWYTWFLTNWGTGLKLPYQFFLTLQQKGALLAGETSAFNSPGQLANKGIEIADQMLTGIWVLSINSIGILVIKGFIILAILASFFFVAIAMFSTAINFYLTVTITTILLPFGVLSHTKFIAEKVFSAIVSLSIKMMVLVCVSCIAAPILISIQPPDPSAANIDEVLKLALGGIAIAYVVWQAPAMAQGLLSGSPTLGDNAVGQIAGAAAGAAGAAKSVATDVIGGGMRVAGFTRAAMNTPGGRNNDGSVNWSGAASNAATIMRQSMPDRSSEFHGRQLFTNARGLQKENEMRTAKQNQTQHDFDKK